MATLCLARGGLAAQEIPFVFKDGLIWIQVTVPQSAQPLNFLLDSGASVSVVNLATAQSLGMKLGPTVRVRGVNSSSRGHWPQKMKARAGTAELPSKYLAVDLSSLSDVCSCRVDGLVGADFFRKQIVQIDFEARVIRLLPVEANLPGGLALDLKQARGALLAPVTVNGSGTQWVRVDTGCTSALQWVSDTEAERGLESSVSIALSETRIPITQATVRLGDMLFESVPTGLHSRPIFRGEDGLLGNGLLRRFGRITINAKAGKMILEAVKPSS